MKIQQISVIGLFGFFNHVIPLNVDERITIIHGPNGFGKTVMLRMLNGLFNSRYSVFRNIPFSKFRVEFDNGSSVEIIKTSDSSGKIKNREHINLEFYTGSERKTYTLREIKDPPDFNFPVDILEEIVPGLKQVGAKRWVYIPTGETLSLGDVIDRFEDILPSKVKLREKSEWLENLKTHIHIRLIESQRLLNIVPNRSSRIYSGSSAMLPTVSAYSDDLAKLIKSKLAEYGTTSQSLDRSFPARVVQQQLSPDLTDDQLRHQLNDLEETRSRLIEVGLLDKDENSDFQIQPQFIDESTKNILSVYVEDVEKKLGVFSEIASKIDLLRRIVNSKFACSYKEMNFDKDKGFVFKTISS